MSTVESIARPRFFCNDTATPEIYTLSLHDALPISPSRIGLPRRRHADDPQGMAVERDAAGRDRKSTRLNSSHDQISYAVFCFNKNQANMRAGEFHIHHKEIRAFRRDGKL